MVMAKMDVLQSLVEAMRTNSPERVLELYTEDCKVLDPAYELSGHEGMLKALRYFFSAFRIRQIEVVQTIEQGDDLAVIWKWVAVHQGEYLGVPPSGRQIDTWNVMILKIRGDKIASDCSVWDAGQFLRLREIAEA